MVKDNGFSRFTSTGDPAENSGNQVKLNELLNEMFEAQKVLFGENYVRGYKGGIELPSAFFKEYEHDIRQSIIEKTESVLKLADQDLRLFHKVMSGFFESVVKGIIERIHETKREVGKIRYNIYLVGGFGGTKYVEMFVREEFERDKLKCSSSGTSICCSERCSIVQKEPRAD